jgi:hypothetical protein
MGDFRRERKAIDTTQDLSKFIGIDKCYFWQGKMCLCQQALQAHIRNEANSLKVPTGLPCLASAISRLTFVG